MTRVKLGLIGDNIRASRSPALHRFCGQLTGLDVSYDLFIPPSLGKTFDQVFAELPQDGIVGTNITLPYKEKVVEKVRVSDPNIARIGACNTVRFGDGQPEGFNTDYSGFVAAYRAAFGDTPPGRVVMVGAGGVGKAVAFGLTILGASEVIFVERDLAKAVSLAKSITEASEGRTQGRVEEIDAVRDADGVINCTPLGMVGYPGSPVPDGAFPKNAWAFDAVYTPVETPFRQQALDAGARFLSGWELFFHQGVDAFEIFTGRKVEDLKTLRHKLLTEA